MKSLGILICALALSALQTLGNPVSTASIEKTWERCLVAIDGETADVSCAVGYKATDGISDPIYFSVPVFLPKDSFSTAEEALSIVSPRLEVAGSVHEPTRVTIRSIPSKFEGTTRVDFAFILAPLKLRSFSIAVTYRQPLLGNRFAYLPGFERGKKPREPSRFTLTAFPKGSGTLQLTTKHEEIAASMSTRITLTPTHDELIVVEHSKPGEQGSVHRSTTRPESISE